MKINGVELDFRLYNQDNPRLREKYMEELGKMRDIAAYAPKGSKIEEDKYLCERIKEFFDGVFGAGTGDTVCGSGNDLLVCLESYEQLISEQIQQDNRYTEVNRKLREEL